MRRTTEYNVFSIIISEKSKGRGQKGRIKSNMGNIKRKWEVFAPEPS